MTITPQTKQEKILTVLGNQLARINPANDTVDGYSFRTTFESVSWGDSRLTEFKRNTLVYVQGEKESEHENMRDRHCLTVEINAYLFANQNIGLALTNAEADIKDAIAIDESFGEGATISNVRSSRSEVEMEGTTAMILSVELEITFYTERSRNYG